MVFRRNNGPSLKPEAVPFDVSTLEAEIGQEFQRSRVSEYAPPPRQITPPPLPRVVEEDIGQLSAAAVGEMYEAAAKSIEAMGTELISVVARTESMVAEFKITMDLLKQTADGYREQAKKVASMIDDANSMTLDVRKACEEMRTKLSAPRKPAESEAVG